MASALLLSAADPGLLACLIERMQSIALSPFAFVWACLFLLVC